MAFAERSPAQTNSPTVSRLVASNRRRLGEGTIKTATAHAATPSAQTNIATGTRVDHATPTLTPAAAAAALAMGMYVLVEWWGHAPVDVRFADAERRSAFAQELSEAVAALARKYHDENASGGRTFKLYLGCYPKVTAPG